MVLLLLACAPPDPAGESAAELELPGHNECRAEPMDEATCLAVVEADGRYPTVSEDKSGFEGRDADARAADPDLAWVTEEARRCTCACCHTGRWGGPGVYFWDLDWSPVWVDSASLWSLGVLAGFTAEPDQTLPTSDLARLAAYVDHIRDERTADPP